LVDLAAMKTSPEVEEAFPGDKKSEKHSSLLQPGTAPPAALDTLLASLAPSTIKQYIRPLRDW